MFTIISHDRQQHFIYFGILLILPERIRFIATSEDGKVLGFTKKPFLGHVSDMEYTWDCLYEHPVILTSCTFNGDWQQSLVEIPY